MHLTVELRYDASPDDVAALLADEEFVRWRSQQTGGPSSVVEQVDVTGTAAAGFTVVVRRTLPTDQIPAHVRPFVGSQLEIRQAEAWEAPSADGVRLGTVVLEITGAPVRLTGTVALEPADGGSVVQRYSGEIKASVPLFGGAVEEAAAGAIRSTLAAEQSATTEWLQTR